MKPLDALFAEMTRIDGRLRARGVKIRSFAYCAKTDRAYMDGLFGEFCSAGHAPRGLVRVNLLPR